MKENLVYWCCDCNEFTDHVFIKEDKKPFFDSGGFRRDTSGMFYFEVYECVGCKRKSNINGWKSYDANDIPTRHQNYND